MSGNLIIRSGDAEREAPAEKLGAVKRHLVVCCAKILGHALSFVFDVLVTKSW